MLQHELTHRRNTLGENIFETLNKTVELAEPRMSTMESVFSLRASSMAMARKSELLPKINAATSKVSDTSTVEDQKVKKVRPKTTNDAIFGNVDKISNQFTPLMLSPNTKNLDPNHKIMQAVNFIQTYQAQAWYILAEYRTKRHNYKHAIYDLKRIYGEEQFNTLRRIKTIVSGMKKIRKREIEKYKTSMRELRLKLAESMAVLMTLFKNSNEKSLKILEDIEDLKQEKIKNQKKKLTLKSLDNLLNAEASKKQAGDGKIGKNRRREPKYTHLRLHL